MFPASIVATIGAELAFTLYVSVYGLSNLVGHTFKILAFYFFYRALVVSGLRRPVETLFLDLKQAQMAVTASLDGTALMDLDGRITFANPALAAMWGRSRSEDMLGVRAEECFADPEVVPEAWRLLFAEGRWEGELTARRHDGRTFDIRLALALVYDEQEVPVAVLASVADISLRKRLEKEKERRNQLQWVGRLAAGIAHDFNNLLTGVLGSLSLAKTEEEAKARGTLIEEAEESCRRAVSLTSELLTFSDGGASVLRIIDVNQLVKQAC